MPLLANNLVGPYVDDSVPKSFDGLVWYYPRETRCLLTRSGLVLYNIKQATYNLGSDEKTYNLSSQTFTNTEPFELAFKKDTNCSNDTHILTNFGIRTVALIDFNCLTSKNETKVLSH